MTYISSKHMLVFLSIGISSVCYAYEDLVTSQLVAEAMHWQGKGRSDLAAESWRRILVTNPTHPQAIVNLGLIAAKAGNVGEATAFYQRAKKLEKTPTGLNQLAALLAQLDPIDPIDTSRVPTSMPDTKGSLAKNKPHAAKASRDLPKEPKKAIGQLMVPPPKAASTTTAAVPSTQTVLALSPATPPAAPSSTSLLMAATALTSSPPKKTTVEPNQMKTELPLNAPQQDNFHTLTQHTPAARRPRPCRQLSVEESSTQEN